MDARLYAATGESVARLDETDDALERRALARREPGALSRGRSRAIRTRSTPGSATTACGGRRTAAAPGSSRASPDSRSSPSRSARRTAPSTPEPSRAPSSAATTAVTRGASSRDCSSCHRGRPGAFRRGRGRRTSAGSRPARTRLPCSWPGSSSAASCARPTAARRGRTTARARSATSTRSRGTRRSQGRAYEAGGGGAAWSEDGGATWRPADEGRDRHYTWSVAVDPVDPELWFVSASTGPLRGARPGRPAGADLPAPGRRLGAARRRAPGAAPGHAVRACRLRGPALRRARER